MKTALTPGWTCAKCGARWITAAVQRGADVLCYPCAYPVEARASNSYGQVDWPPLPAPCPRCEAAGAELARLARLVADLQIEIAGLPRP